MSIRLYGVETLTASNFALTASQSSTDMAAGAALDVKKAPQGGLDYSYTGLQGGATRRTTRIIRTA